MTGIRSWTAEVTAFGVVVRIEQLSTVLPLASFQRSHNPANANNSPSIDLEAVWLLGFPRPHPLVKAVCGNQAPTRFQRLTECRSRASSFRPGIDHACADSRVFRPRWN